MVGMLIRYLLHLIQKALNLLRRLEVRFEHGWRGCTREPLSNRQDSRMLKDVEDLAAQKATGSSNKDCGRHWWQVVWEKVNCR